MADIPVAFQMTVGEMCIRDSTCPVYGGNVLNDVVLHTRPAVATVRGGSFSKSIEAGKAGKIIEETVEITEESVFTKIANVVKEISEAVNLEDADVIVLSLIHIYPRSVGSTDPVQSPDAP